MTDEDEPVSAFDVLKDLHTTDTRAAGSEPTEATTEPTEATTEPTEATTEMAETKAMAKAKAVNKSTDPGIETSKPARSTMEEQLLTVFANLAPQGTVTWGFDDAMRRLSEPRPLVETVGAWDGLPADLWQRGKSAKMGERLVGDVATVLAQLLADDARRVTETAVEASSRTAWEGLRYLSARVEALERQVSPASMIVPDLERQAPSPDLADVAISAAKWFQPTDTSRPVFHGDCGDGTLLRSLSALGFDVRGADPRADAVWQALGGKDGPSRIAHQPTTSESAVVLASTLATLGAFEDNALSGAILSGCIDRSAVADSLAILAEAVRATGPGGTVAVVSTDPGAWDAIGSVVVRDLLPGRPLHPETWLLLMERSGLENPVWHRPSRGSVHVIVGTQPI